MALFAKRLGFVLPVFVAIAAISSSMLGCSSDSESTPAADTGTVADTGTPSDTGSGTDTGSSTDTPAALKDIVDTAVAAGSFKTLVAAVTAADLGATLKGAGPFTVFAPTDDAFKKLPAGTVDTLLKPENKTLLQNILKYHVVGANVPASDVVKLIAAKTLFGKDVLIAVEGGKVTLTDGKGSKVAITTTDVAASNGVIHVIDAVLMPPEPTKDIVDTAVGAGTFKTLAAALTAADLVTTLKGKGPFTVFAPTDAAFEKLPKGTVETLLKPENKAMLASILTYHVVAGDVQASDVVKTAKAKTVEGTEVSISADASGVTITDAKGGKSKVTAVNINATNGVIHVIDTVIMPK